MVASDQSIEDKKNAMKEVQEKDKALDQELIVIQENLYPIKMVVPGIETFEVQVSDLKSVPNFLPYDLLDIYTLWSKTVERNFFIFCHCSKIFSKIIKI